MYTYMKTRIRRHKSCLRARRLRETENKKIRMVVHIIYVYVSHTHIRRRYLIISESRLCSVRAREEPRAFIEYVRINRIRYVRVYIFERWPRAGTEKKKSPFFHSRRTCKRTCKDIILY